MAPSARDASGGVTLPAPLPLHTEAHPEPWGRVIGRGMRLRCPVCGQGPMFRGITTRDHCPVCGFLFEREVGYFTNGIVLNYMLACTATAFIVTPLALIVRWPLYETIGAALALALGLTALVFLHAKSLWLAADLVARPPVAGEFVDPSLPDPPVPPAMHSTGAGTESP